MSARIVTTRALAKINWTLEVLGKRPDGYHEVRTLLQTIELADELRILPNDRIALSVRQAPPEFIRLSEEHPDSNLAYRAAILLQKRCRVSDGAGIELSKHIPIAAGLGGGSSDAAAVLRCLRRLWKLDVNDDELAAIGAELGSDVPFFIRGGTALASGRGEVVEQLPDALPSQILVGLASAEGSDKTARMYAALRPEHYTDGSATERLAERIRMAQPVQADGLCNVFESVVDETEAGVAAKMQAARAAGLRPHLCGSGPAFFLLDEAGANLTERLSELAPFARCRTVGALTASAISEVL
jgi:4-diphosphocytidyl-2-C-methyl-D-erythritol kinase